MGDGQEDPGSTRKMKKLVEKPQVATNREYLDMDTDEEEFGRQETPELEEELELEPEKPVFTVEQLNCLVRYVKDLTTLSSLTETDWSPESIETIEEYFRNPAKTVLAIFRREKMLKAILEFPSCIVDELFYFLRAPWQIYTTENFLSNVICGSIGGIDNSILSFMENLWAPIAFNSDEWPIVVRNELFTNVNEFISCFIDVTYNPTGLTILYVPREGLTTDGTPSKIVDEVITSSKNIGRSLGSSQDEDETSLLERLERVARYWIRQIREAIGGTSTCDVTSSTGKTIADEIRYWHYRYENLSCVNRQLTCDGIVGIIEKLKSARSSSVDNYDPLLTRVRENLSEAESNIKYLNLLEEFDDEFEIPVGVENHAFRTLSLIRFVAEESPCYNSEEKIEILCRAFCVQFVNDFREFVDLDVVLDGDASAGRIMLVGCIEGCDELSRVYDRLTFLDSTGSSSTIRLAERSKVFNCVDTLVHRCHDLITVADARIVFDKSDEPIAICGPKGLDLGLRYRKIEKRFGSLLSEIKNVRHTILDIVSTVWLDHVVDFKKRLKDIENMVKNWIDDVFNDVMNVEDGVEALHGIARFSRRPYLRRTLNDKWIKIWKIFDTELDIRSALIKKNSIFCYPSLSNYSGKAMIIRGNKIHLEKQYKMLIDASDWFGDCDAQSIVIQKYERVLAAMDEKEDKLFLEWQEKMIDEKIDIAVALNQPIIKYHDDNTKNRSLVVNLQIFHIDRVRDIGEWTLLDRDAKNIFSKDFPNWETLQLRYNKVDYVCKMYNSIVVDASDRERFFFASILNDHDEILNSGLHQTNWKSDSFEIFFKGSVEILIKIRESFEFYRSVNWKIDYLIETMAVTRFAADDTGMLSMLNDCDDYLADESYRSVRSLGAKELGKNLKLILELLLQLRNTINPYEERISKHWMNHIDEIYEKLKNSLINRTRLSLRRILEILRDDESLTKIRGTPSNLQRAKTSIAEIGAFIVEEALNPIETFDEIFDTLEKNRKKILIEVVDQDPRSNDLKKLINEYLDIGK